MAPAEGSPYQWPVATGTATRIKGPYQWSVVRCGVTGHWYRPQSSSHAVAWSSSHVLTAWAHSKTSQV